MRTVPLGEAGVQINARCLGCMFFGTRVEWPSERLLHRYAAAGSAFLDTANNYAFWVAGARGGESDAVLAGWIDHVGISALWTSSAAGRCSRASAR
jgi:aryl-alcohol dehydrogenase-like predicted oxidoreductase